MAAVIFSNPSAQYNLLLFHLQTNDKSGLKAFGVNHGNVKNSKEAADTINLTNFEPTGKY
jgi:hypothetical protein